MPGALAPDPRPVDTDLLHFSHLLGQPPIPQGRGRPTLGSRPSRGRLQETRSSVGTFCEGRYEPPPAVGVTQRCTCRVESSAAGRWHEGATGWGRSARGAGPGRVRGLRPWCGWPRELAQDVADVL